jgi:hypothetical protein
MADAEAADADAADAVAAAAVAQRAREALAAPPPGARAAAELATLRCGGAQLMPLPLAALRALAGVQR